MWGLAGVEAYFEGENREPKCRDGQKCGEASGSDPDRESLSREFEFYLQYVFELLNIISKSRGTTPSVSVNGVLGPPTWSPTCLHVALNLPNPSVS